MKLNIILVLFLFLSSCNSDNSNVTNVRASVDPPKGSFAVESYDLIGAGSVYVIWHRSSGKKFIVASKNNAICIIPFN